MGVTAAATSLARRLAAAAASTAVELGCWPCGRSTPMSAGYHGLLGARSAGR
jgi:hypothetical protein